MFDVSFLLFVSIVFASLLNSARKITHLSKALVKAMLTSPSQDANGYSNTFGIMDFNSLKACGSNRALATEAAEWMESADEFIQAYGSRIASADISKLMNKFEVRFPMFVHNKKHDTRASFSSLLAIAVDLYKELKVLDPKIPKWTKIPDDALKVGMKHTANPKHVSLRETGSNIGESLLAEKGYHLNGHVTEVSTGHTYIISDFTADGASANLTLTKAATPSTKKSQRPPKTLTVPRIDLLQGINWHASECTEPTFLDPVKIVMFQDNLDFKGSIMIGEIKSKLAIEVKKTNESDMRLQTHPSVAVVSSKQFNPGAMKLLAISNAIIVANDKSAMLRSAPYILFSGDNFSIYMKSSNDSLSSKSSQDTHLCSMFWHTGSSFDQGSVNCQLSEKDFVISVLGEKMTIKIPMIVNTKPIKAGDTIKYLKKSEVAEAEPPTKKFKFSVPAKLKK